ncbi:MAG TPA: Uma2 family endonuclease [Thermomonospora sp.]|nr:Uma2 family endonuclease [Thermomonospora sp.]
MTEEEYTALPEDVARMIEVVHGHVIRCESPVPRHNRIARRLAGGLEAGRTPGGPCLSVGTDLDVVLWRVPKFTFRRPDVVVYECIDDPTRKPSAREALMVVEVSSPSTGREDLVDKKSQYASAGIPAYLVVVLDDKFDIAEIKEFHLDAVTREYRLHTVHRSVLELEHPIRVTLSFGELLAD